MPQQFGPIVELIDLLTDQELSAEALSAIAEDVKGAPENPDYEWAGDPSTAMLLALSSELDVAVSDKIDELHEQLDNWFTDPLPPYPYDTDEISGDSLAYFRWLDNILAQRVPEKGGYAILSVAPGIDDNLSVVVAYRRNIDRILELAKLLDINIRLENGVE